MLHLIRPFDLLARAPERLKRVSRDRVHGIRAVGTVAAIPFREFRGVLAGPLPEYQQIGQRVPAEPVRAVQARSAFTGGEETGHVVICVSPSTRIPPIA